MALLTDTDENYTKTGKGTLTSIANKLSVVPFLRNFGSFFGKIPFVSGTFGALLGYADTIIESAQWLFRGQFGSAVTVAAAGFVGNSVNFASEATSFWWGNAASTALTGATLGTHARAATETLIGSITGALGSKPQVLASYPAGIGSIGGVAPVSGIGRRDGFVGAEAARRGQTADAAWARINSSDADHVAALQAAQAQDNVRGM